MARPLRIEFAGAVYHVTTRGNVRRPIARDDQDRRSWLRLLGEVVNRYHWLCHAYCFMTNHYHLLPETPEGNLEQEMRQLNGAIPTVQSPASGGWGISFRGGTKPFSFKKTRISWRCVGMWS